MANREAASLPEAPVGRFRRKAVTWVADKIAHSFEDPGQIWELIGPSLTRWTDDIRLPEGSYLNGSPHIHRYPSPAEEKISVGKYCSIASDVSFVLSGNHHAEWVTTSPLPVILGLSGYEGTDLITGKGGIEIGSDVWIGRGAMLLSGTVIGDGAVRGQSSAA